MKSTVLIVDDDPVARRRLCTRLESEGFRTLVAANGREALSVLEDQLPSLIMIDLAMPVMDGWKLMQALRCYEELASIPIVLMSEGEGQDVAAQAPQIPLVRKPLDRDEAFEALRFTLSRLTASAA
ncbi:MAG TPA: response regulator [Polyangia bacterium]|nr:response regulator [Polyangia bacterium]